MKKLEVMWYVRIIYNWDGTKEWEKEQYNAEVSNSREIHLLIVHWVARYSIAK